MAGSERKRELRRRRQRRKKLQVIKRRAATANVSEKRALAEKLRNLTPGAETVIATLSLEA